MRKERIITSVSYGTVKAISQREKRLSVKLENKKVIMATFIGRAKSAFTDKPVKLAIDQKISFRHKIIGGRIFFIEIRIFDMHENFDNSINDFEHNPWSEVKGYENCFGDKYLGIVEREGGTYGSICLYDDYGDESES